MGWTSIQIFCYLQAPSSASSGFYPAMPLTIKGGPRRPNRKIDNQHHNHNATTKAKKKKNVEELAPGCEYADWQLQANLMKCNALHELDLKLLLGRSFGSDSNKRTRRRKRSNNTTGNSTFAEDNPPSSLGKYLSSGLWRDVWSLRVDAGDHFLHDDVTNDDAGKAVLKMMKMEHDVIPRNLERHRREAVTMERLSPSPYVIDLFAYCGNTILTEFASQDLSTAIKESQQSQKKLVPGSRKSPRRVRQDIPEIRGYQNQGDNHDVVDAFPAEEQHSKLPQHLTPIQRLEFAIQAAKGVQALHDNDIIHADLTAKQFL
ncbi:MAG: hypothetical protein SGILL_001522, partial [Bacillariaceae sp.]